VATGYGVELFKLDGVDTMDNVKQITYDELLSEKPSTNIILSI